MSVRLKRRHVPPRFLEQDLQPQKVSLKESHLPWQPIPEFSGTTLRIPNPNNTSEFRAWKDLKGKNEKSVKGKFSFAEDQLLRARLVKFFELKGWSWDEGLKHLIKSSRFHKGRKKDVDPENASPWVYIAACLPDRHIESIIQHVQCSFYEWPKKGRWNDIDSRRLVVLYRKYGNDWKYIGSVLDRYWRTCCDHYKMLEERGRVDYYYQLAIEAGDEDPDSFAPLDAAPELAVTQPIDAEVHSVPNESLRNKRMRFTTIEDNALLAIIADICKMPYPIKMIPWTIVHQKFIQQFPNASVTSKSLLARYIMVLLPRSGRLTGHCAMIRRSIWRFLLTLLQQNPDLHWTEVKWNTIIPHWSGLRCQTLAKSTIARCAGLSYRAAASILNDDRWKPYVRCLYKRTQCPQFEKEDAQALLNYLEAVKEANGVDPLNPRLPLDLREEEMRNYTRKRLKEIRQEQVRTREQTEHQAAIADGNITGMDYLEKRLMQTLDLIDVA